MTPHILPKSRTLSGSSGMVPSSRVGSLQEHGGLINKRLPSGNRVLSNHRVLSNSRQYNRNLIDDDSDVSFADETAIKFDENKNTILSNFEEWIKLSTDNKITSKNSWQIALIDFFHDLNVIKDGESINFQRASATLDGCIKIYSSRVESAATETGKLLSGLAKNKSTNEEAAVDSEIEEENDSNNDVDVANESKKKRKINRVVESTLVPFETLRVKKFEQELAIDPLFKKALAEFDEGGAKSLLLNTLNIDSTGKVVFDATTTQSRETEARSNTESQRSGSNVDFSKLEEIIWDDHGDLESLTIAPSMPPLKSVLSDVNKAKTILSDVNNQLDVPNEIQDVPKYSDEIGNFDFEDLDDDPVNDINDNDNDNDAIDNMNQSIIQQIFQEDQHYVDKSQSAVVLDKDLMAYFDSKLKATWKGPEHWKVAALKKSKNIDSNKAPGKESSSEPGASSKNKKDKTVINFLEDDDDSLEALLFEKPKKPSSINKQPNQEKDLHKNLLPEDINFSSAKLTNLFTKPSMRIISFSRQKSNVLSNKTITDENFFAQQYEENGKDNSKDQDRMAMSFHQAEFEDFNNDFGDDYGDIDFNDALDSGNYKGEKPTIGSQLASESLKGRSEQLNFSKVAKRVDVKLLKDNLWESIRTEQTPLPIKKEQDEAVNEDNGSEKENSPKKSLTNNEQDVNTLKNEKTFGEIYNTLGTMYTSEQKKDLSTSFCFICLLHLANEHGLDIKSNETHDDLSISGF